MFKGDIEILELKRECGFKKQSLLPKKRTPGHSPNRGLGTDRMQEALCEEPALEHSMFVVLPPELHSYFVHSLDASVFFLLARFALSYL